MKYLFYSLLWHLLWLDTRPLGQLLLLSGLRVQFSSPLNTLISRLYSGWGQPVLTPASYFVLFFSSSVSQQGGGCLSGWGVTHNTGFLIFTQVAPLLSALLHQRLLKTLSWSFGVSSAGSQLGAILRFSMHNLTFESPYSLLINHFYYCSDSLFILSIIHHRYTTTEGWNHLLKYLAIIEDTNFKRFLYWRELKKFMPVLVPCQVLVLLSPGDFID